MYISLYLYNDITRAEGSVGGCGAPERRYVAIWNTTVNFTFIILFAMFYRKNYGKKKTVTEASGEKPLESTIKKD